jgi:beta-phosphoglucomutase-like phosphatase (HAD superfamily)
MSLSTPEPMTRPESIVFLVDVDNTLLDNDRIQTDIQVHFERQYGAQCRERYWMIQERLFADLGYRDYLGAVQTYHAEYPDDIRVLTMASYLIDYPFAERIYPGALAVLERLAGWGRTVILTDGDVVFQPRKVERAGLWRAVDGHLLIYIHKEQSLADIEQRYPARHYVVVDDKLRILTAVKKTWSDRVTTVFVRQGKFAVDPDVIASCPPADVTIERIGDLLAWDLSRLIKPSHPL